MKKALFSIILLMTAGLTYASGEKDVWKNAYINSQNRYMRHAAYFAFEDQKHAESLDKTNSKN